MESHWDRLPRDAESRILEGAGRLEHSEKLHGVLKQIPAAAISRACARAERMVVRVVRKSDGWFGDHGMARMCGHNPRLPDFTKMREAVRVVLTTSQSRCSRSADCMSYNLKDKCCAPSKECIGEFVDWLCETLDVHDSAPLFNDDEWFWWNLIDAAEEEYEEEREMYGYENY